MTSTMKALVFAQPDAPLAVEERPIPRAEAGQIVLRVSACGVCGSDLHATESGPSRVPLGTVLGHEFSGVVVESAAESWKVGDRAIGIPYWLCDPCRPEGECRERLGMHCRHSRTVGMSPGVPGGYAQYVRIGGRQALRVPDGLDINVAALAEPLAVGARSVRLAGPLLGRRVLVMGAGPIGLAVVIFAHAAGAREVIVSEISAPRRERALQFGGSAGIDPSSGDVATEFARLTGGPPEVIFECVGAPTLLQQSMELADVRGRIVVVGVNRMQDPISPMLGVLKELYIQFARAYETVDFELAIDQLRKLGPRGADLISKVVGLNDLPAVFDALRRPNSHNKVLLDPHLLG